VQKDWLAVRQESAQEKPVALSPSGRQKPLQHWSGDEQAAPVAEQSALPLQRPIPLQWPLQHSVGDEQALPFAEQASGKQRLTPVAVGRQVKNWLALPPQQFDPWAPPQSSPSLMQANPGAQCPAPSAPTVQGPVQQSASWEQFSPFGEQPPIGAQLLPPGNPEGRQSDPQHVVASAHGSLAGAQPVKVAQVPVTASQWPEQQSPPAAHQSPAARQ